MKYIVDKDLYKRIAASISGAALLLAITTIVIYVSMEVPSLLTAIGIVLTIVIVAASVIGGIVLLIYGLDT